MVILNFFLEKQEAVNERGFPGEVNIYLYDNNGNLTSYVCFKNYDGISEITIYYNDKTYVYDPATMNITESTE